MHSENITKVLYPNDEMLQGKTLRLQQQFFFVTCSLQDMIRIHLLLNRPLDTVSTRNGPSSSTTPTRRSPSPS